MAKIDNIPLVKGARGSVGKQFVFKRRGNGTHITRMPEFREDAVASPKQEALRELFAAASSYGRKVIASPDLKREYQKKVTGGRTAYNIAVRDYLKAPVVKKINTEAYDGSPSSTIVIKAKDDFRVVEVKVSIRTVAGVLVEEGNAVLNPVKKNRWIYTAKQGNASLAGSIISATAWDLPGNTGMLEVMI